MKVARWVSIAAALHFSTPREAFRTLLVVTLIALLPVAVLMVRQVRRGLHAGSRVVTFGPPAPQTRRGGDGLLVGAAFGFAIKNL